MSDRHKYLKNITLRVGDYTKIVRAGERFWLEVVDYDKERGWVIGVVANDMLMTSIHNLKLGDKYFFTDDQILQIMRPSEVKGEDVVRAVHTDC